MARYSISDTTLTALGDAVRSKVGETRKGLVPDKVSYDLTLPPHEQIMETISSGNTYNLKILLIGTHYENIQITYVDTNSKLITKVFDENNECFISRDTLKSKSTNGYIANISDEECNFTIDIIKMDDNGNEILKETDIPNTMTPLQMAEAIDGMIEIPDKALLFTDICSYKFAYNHWNWFIEACGDKITTQGISSISYMFYQSDTLQEIPFSIHLSPSSTYHAASAMFQNCNKLINIPMIYSLKVQDMGNMFSGCMNISSFPENFAKDWDWSRLDNATSAYTGTASNSFSNCMKLREIPQELLIHGNPFWSYTYTRTNSGFNNCYGLEKLENVFIPYKSTGMTSNGFGSMVKNCCRLKKLTLQTQQDGTPYDVSGWKSQTIDLSTVGYGSISFMRLVDLTEETKIDNEEKWRGYIDGSYPDGWGASVEYSTFGATAVKEFIASLPNITNGSNNTIKLNQRAASAIPGEEMTSLTEEDIAVATEKGWTITFV